MSALRRSPWTAKSAAERASPLWLQGRVLDFILAPFRRLHRPSEWPRVGLVVVVVGPFVLEHDIGPDEGGWNHDHPENDKERALLGRHPGGDAQDDGSDPAKEHSQRAESLIHGGCSQPDQSPASAQPGTIKSGFAAGGPPRPAGWCRPAPAHGRGLRNEREQLDAPFANGRDQGSREAKRLPRSSS